MFPACHAAVTWAIHVDDMNTLEHRSISSRILSVLGIAAVAAFMPACGSSGSGSASLINIDGSSTVFPITEAVAEEFHKVNAARVTIGVSGTGGGFKKFCGGGDRWSPAPPGPSSRPRWRSLRRQAGIEYIELPVAYRRDRRGGTRGEHLGRPHDRGRAEATVGAGRPGQGHEVEPHPHRLAREARCTCSDRASTPGTYDYFTKAIVGTEHASRGDFTSSEDDNVLVQGVALPTR